MPRTKKDTAATAKSTAKNGKRSAPDTQADSTPQGTRSSKRLKTSSAANETPLKSKYFKESEDELSAVDEKDGSGYDDEVEEEEQSSGSEEEYDSEEDVKPKKKTKSSPGQAASNKELWREGVKTGLGPGKAVYIEKPQARGDGGVKYVPQRIHPNTMDFLKDLKKNNDRVWLKAHDPDYRQAWKDFESFVQTLTEKIGEIDETIPELPPKDLVFRIYRDVRFSSDPTPYKPHFSAAWSRTGRKGPYACYYVQIQPGEHSFVGGGLWHPEAEPVRLLRADIDQSRRLKDVLLNADVRKHMLGGIKKDEKAAVKKFCDQNAEGALKTKPKGFEADNPNIDLLRLRNFTIGHKVTDKELLSPQGLDRIVELITAMHPFVTYLNSVVMPDEEAAPDSDGDSESSEEAAPDSDGDSESSEEADLE